MNVWEFVSWNGGNSPSLRRVAVQFTILGSGSAGNCAYLETDEARLLIDAGLSARQIRQRLLTLARTPENLTGILITHEHSDHIQGLAVLATKLNVPIYCNRLTKEAIERFVGSPVRANIFATGASFEVNDVRVDTFSVPHDANDPVGFLLHTSAGRVGFLTDLGHATKLVIERVRTANALVLEANHDMKLLQDDTRRPWSIKQRILSRHGHLSNVAAAEVAAQIVTADLRQLYLGHLSGDCNRPEIARAAVSESLHAVGARHVAIAVAAQETPCATLTMAPTGAVPHGEPGSPPVS